MENYNTIKLSNNAEKFRLQVRSRFGALPVGKKVSPEETTLSMKALMSMAWLEELMFHPTYTYINKTVKDFDAVAIGRYFSKRKSRLQKRSLTEIQAYARKEFDKLWDEQAGS